MVLLERVRLLTQGHNHDDPTRRLLNTCTHLGKLRTAHPDVPQGTGRHGCSWPPRPPGPHTPGAGGLLSSD